MWCRKCSEPCMPQFELCHKHRQERAQAERMSMALDLLHLESLKTCKTYKGKILSPQMARRMA
jgi:hypothetical protein